MTQVQNAQVSALERFVTFRVAEETYAVPALSVREVIRWVPATRVPHSNRSVKGVINLRGEIVVVLDLRTELNLEPADPTDRTCIVVVTIHRPQGRMQVGLIVDVALEVVRIGPQDVEAMSSASTTGAHVIGVARSRTKGGGLTMILDVERLALAGSAADAAAVTLALAR